METNELVQVRTIEEVTGDILEAKRVGGEAILTIGKGLIEAKEMLEHGEWLPWLNERVEFSERQAQRFMRLASEYSNPTLVSDLGARKALALLALPESEREEFVESSHQVNGQEKTVADMTTRELEQAIRERDEAKRRLDEAHKEISEAHVELQNAARLEEQLKKARESAKKDSECAGLWAKKAAELEKELKELKARPVEVAVERDEAALQELEEERDKALEEIDALRRSLAEADANHMEADAAREVLSRQMELARARIRKLESGGPEGVDTNPMQFRLFVDEARDCVNRALGVLSHLCDKEDQTDADEARAALMELAEYIREAAA